MPPTDPPREAIEAIARIFSPHPDRPITTDAGRPALAWTLCTPIAWRTLALPAADKWRLIGWLAEGLEPTEAMRRAGIICLPDGCLDLSRMLAAARGAA